MNDPRTIAEVSRRAANGYHPTTMEGMRATLASLGYKLCPYHCYSNNLYVDSGESYPADNRNVNEADTGLSAFHFQARRDENFRTLQRLRFNGELFAVVSDRIVSI